ncbi:glucosamine-6-phosphate deaminase [Thermodesulfobacteriota bacterium]
MEEPVSIQSCSGRDFTLIVTDSGRETGACCAGMIRDLLQKQSGVAVLGLASGRSPIPVYRELVRLCQSGEITFRNVKTFNLDEYVGVGLGGEGSFRQFMEEHLFQYVDIRPENIHFPHLPVSRGGDPDLSCSQYETLIQEAGGIDLQVLGIGPNGHVAFNEPGSAFDSRTRVIALTDDTRRHNARSFGSFEKVPERAITMGIGTILEAKRIVLLANGPEKAAVLAAAVLEPPTQELPASALQPYGSECTIIADRDAAVGFLSAIENLPG